jgi:hypothetical protein
LQHEARLKAVKVEVISTRTRQGLASSRSSRYSRRRGTTTYLSDRWHGELEGQAGNLLVEIHLVILGVVLLLEHRLAVLCDEGIHLEMLRMSVMKKERDAEMESEK